MKINKPQLTISLLASDRPDILHRCLDSLKVIMDAIPCELILIDTSKNPVVHNILLEYTNQVYEFEWCKDFAKARNEGIRRAKGEWFLYLDDDEWFVESDAIVEFFHSGEYRQYGYACYQVRNFLDANYACYNDGWVSRMIRLDGDTHFVSKIHEYLVPVQGPRKSLQAMVYHSGYIYETEDEKRAHFERNCSLLLEMIKEEPDNIRWWLQLVQEYSYMNEWEKLENYCIQCLKRIADENEDYICMNIGTFYTGLVTALFQLQKYEDGVPICKQALNDKRSRDVLKAMMHLKLGEFLFALGKRSESIEEVTQYFHMVQTIDQGAWMIIEEKSALLVGNAFDENHQAVAYGILICNQLEEGSMDALLDCYDKLNWHKAIIYFLKDMEKYLVKAMWTFQYHLIFMRIIIDAFKNKKLRELFCKEILLQSKSEMNVFQEMLFILAEAFGDIMDGPREDDVLGYYNALQKYVQAVSLWYDFVQEQDAVVYLGEELPGYIQAAIAIGDYIELEPQDEVQALGKLKDAVDVFPELAEGMGKFLHSYEKLENQRVEIQRNEMENLRVQVIGQVKVMLEAGQIEIALQIATQLKQMFPNDLEVDELYRKIN